MYANGTQSLTTLALRAIQPPAMRVVCRGTTMVHAETKARHAKWLADDAAIKRKKRKDEPRFLMDHVELDRADRRAQQEFRARKRLWKARFRFIYPKMVVGLMAVSGRLSA